MKLLPVMSTSVAGMGWKAYPSTPDTGQLAVQFAKGGWYLYERVGIYTFVGILMADSIGKAFAEFKRVQAVPYRETTPEEVAHL